jgi:protease I
VSPKSGKIKSWRFTEWGDEFDVDKELKQANASDYDALLLPGGVINPDKLRMIPEAVAFVKSFCAAGKPIAAICHGPWSLLEAGIVKGRKITSWPSLKTDLRNAGADWVDQEVVVDGNLITSRNPDDIPAFNREMIRMIAHAQAKRPAA